MTSEELHSRITDKEDFVILGQTLEPLCIGHLEMLAKFGVEFPSDPVELLLAVLICAMEPREVVPWFKDPDLHENLETIGSQLGDWDFQEKLNLWQDYWQWHTKMPTITTNAQLDGAPCGVPWHQVMRSILLSKLNYRPSEIASTTVLQAQWDIAGLRYCEGRIRVMTEDIDSRPPMPPDVEAQIADMIRKRQEQG